MTSKKYFWGIIFIIFGALGILNEFFNINLFAFGNLWPLFVLVPGIYFEFEYFSTRKSPGLLVPGGILVTIGLLFVFETMTHWRFSLYTWPVYILAPAIGLIQLYYFGGRDKGLLVSIGTLLIITVVSIIPMVFGNVFSWLRGSLVFPILLIGVGLYIILQKDKYIKK